MKTRSPEIDDRALINVLAEKWRFGATAVQYAAQGAGSHLGADGAFLADIRKYVVWGPQALRRCSLGFGFAKISYRACRIEIGDSTSNPKLFDSRSQRWYGQNVDYSRSVVRTIAGVKLSVIPVDDLVAYKLALSRPVDLLDIAEIRAE